MSSSMLRHSVATVKCQGHCYCSCIQAIMLPPMVNWKSLSLFANFLKRKWEINCITDSMMGAGNFVMKGHLKQKFRQYTKSSSLGIPLFLISVTVRQGTQKGGWGEVMTRSKEPLVKSEPKPAVGRTIAVSYLCGMHKRRWKAPFCHSFKQESEH